MTFYALSALINGIISTILGTFVFTRNKKDPRYVTHSIFSLTVAVWSYFYFIWQVTAYEKVALFACRGLMAGAIFIPVCYLHHLAILFDIYNQKKKIILYGYLGGLFFLILDFTPLFVKSVSQKLIFKFWPDAGIAYPLFLTLWFGYVLYGIFIIVNKYRKSVGAEKNQVKYIFVATFIGWSGGATNFALWFNIPMPPFGNILVSGYMLILTYAILRYRLMDINIALTRAGIFTLVYTFVLGIPFFLGYKYGLWQFATWITVFLASAGPFIFIYLRRKAEEKLLEEQRRYQQTLRQASAGMTRIHNLRKLLDLITHIVTKTVKIAYAAIYIYDKQTNEYTLQVCRDKGRIAISKLTLDNPLIKHIIATHEPLIYEEIKSGLQNKNHFNYMQLEENMRLLTANVIIPGFLDERLMCLLVLGEKTSKQIYTLDDLNVFQVLAGQAALAIENAKFYEETRRMQEQIAQAEKMSTIGTMADGLSHQINNRFYALSLITSDTIEIIKEIGTSNCSPELKNAVAQINHAMERIQENVVQGGQVVKGILKYTRKDEEGFEALSLDQILDSALDMLQYKIDLSKIDIIRNYSKNLPRIKGNSAQLSEVFFNFCDNAYDAIGEFKNLYKQDGYRGRITISASPKDNFLAITIQDNGIGIKDENTKKIFTPFFTTKISYRRGTGLGLYVINKIITDTHKGKLSFKSTYGKGATFLFELPLWQIT